MRPARSRWSVISVTVSLAMLISGSATLAQDADEDPICGVLTSDEVTLALGTAVEAGIGSTYEDRATCVWIASDPASFGYADATWQDVPLELIVDGLPGGTELTVAGYPAYLAPAVGALHIRLDDALLTLSMASDSPDIDVAAALTTLGEAAAPRAVSLPAPAPAAPGDDGLELPESDPVADAFCALFTPEEVGAAAGHGGHGRGLVREL